MIVASHLKIKFLEVFQMESSCAHPPSSPTFETGLKQTLLDECGTYLSIYSITAAYI